MADSTQFARVVRNRETRQIYVQLMGVTILEAQTLEQAADAAIAVDLMAGAGVKTALDMPGVDIAGALQRTNKEASNG